MPAGGQGLITRADLAAAIAGITAANDLPYDATPPAVGVARRMLDRKQQLYYAEDANGVPTVAAALGSTGPHALPFESYQLALTAGLVSTLVSDAASFSNGVAEPIAIPALLTSTDPGGGFYVQRPGDTGYWTRSGQLQFDATHFYLPVTLTDPFNQTHAITYDPQFRLLVATTQDPLGNIVQAVNDFRVLAPSQITDPNLNRVQVQFDARGMVVATAVMGKTSENLGDTLAAPTTQIIYDVLRWQTSQKPVVVHTLARKVHQVDGFLESYTYSDGFGRVAMKKVQAEPGPVPGSSGTIDPRWVGTGRTVFNNKGNPVKQYEPFFSATFEFEDETTVVQAGVTPIIHYDALDRVVRTELPNGTESSVEFDAWQQISSDPNDTVLATTWYSSRGSPDPSGVAPTNPEQRAAYLAARTAETPNVTGFDSLGRPFLVTEQNRTWDDSVSPATFTDAFFPTRTVMDVEGNALAIIDARQAAANPTAPLATLTQRFDVLSRTQRTDSSDAGTRLMLPDVGGKPLRRWDTRFQVFRFRYDELQRPSHLVVQKTKAEGSGLPGQTPEDLTPRLLLRTIYGEALDPVGPPPTQITAATPASPAQALNLRGQPYLIFDCAGQVTSDLFDFKANLLSSTRRLAADFQTEPKWNTAPNDLTALTNPIAVQTAANAYLDPISTAPLTSFRTQSAYDALNRITSRTTPDGSVTLPTYNTAGLLETLQVGVRGATPGTVISNIDYNARGQRILYAYADPTSAAAPVTCQVAYAYDPFTFRLTNLVTSRAVSGSVPAAELQDLLYTYDPVGNVVELDDNGDTAPIFSGTTPVRGDGFYRYDSIYRLIMAQGREHPGQQQPTGTFEIANGQIPHPNDLQALVQYVERYTYDQVGNIQRIAHAPIAGGASWTRSYQYDAASNRLLSNNDPDATGGTATYAYTGNGAMNKMAHLPVIEWDYADRMRHANRGSGGGDVFFTYDGSGQRVRKVFQPSTSTTLTERIYIGGWETFRSRAGGAITSPVTLERETLHVMDDARRIGMVETTTTGTGPVGPLWRFQLGNLLDSAVMELDPQGRVISYEEYHPFGSTAFRSADGASEVSPKRYRYTGKEKDEETGLYYHGARYYAPWLGRWTAADPLTLSQPGRANLNSYAYARSAPLGRTDPSGLDDVDAAKAGKAAGTAAYIASRTAGHNAITLSQGPDKVQQFTYKAGRATVTGYYIPGETREVALIYGGIHGNEFAAKELGARTAAELTKPGASKPHYTTIIIPDIFGGTQHTRNVPKGAASKDVMDPNRSFPAIGTALSDAVPSGGTQPYDARPNGRQPIPEALQQVIRIREQYQPTRILQLHGIVVKEPAPKGSTAGPSITSDRRPGLEAPDAQLTRQMIAEAKSLGARLPANARGNIDYPTNAKSTPHELGTTGGFYLSHDEVSNGVVVAPGANVLLIETYNNEPSSAFANPTARLNELDALRSSILNVFLRN